MRIRKTVDFVDSSDEAQCRYWTYTRYGHEPTGCGIALGHSGELSVRSNDLLREVSECLELAFDKTGDRTLQLGQHFSYSRLDCRHAPGSHRAQPLRP
jgi:hypothetical protein